VAGEDVKIGNATVWGGLNVPSQMPVASSRLYSANLVAISQLFVKEGTVTMDFDDEILDGACVTHDGQVRFAPAREALEGGS
jgi:NAD(P) transhydrogenase subunit alpha